MTHQPEKKRINPNILLFVLVMLFLAAGFREDFFRQMKTIVDRKFDIHTPKPKAQQILANADSAGTVSWPSKVCRTTSTTDDKPDIRCQEICV